MVNLALAETPGWDSPYGPGEALCPLPRRMRALTPSALAAILPLAPRLVFTDVYRSMVGSLEAHASKRGVQPPGFSAHNFGLAFDLDVERSLRKLGLPVSEAGKAQLDALLEAAGWICYRSDHLVDAPEAWHYTFGATAHGSAGVEAAIVAAHPEGFALDAAGAQQALLSLRLYADVVDGQWGGHSRAALSAFQRQWSLPETGELDARSQRVLAVATANVTIAPLPVAA